MTVTPHKAVVLAHEYVLTHKRYFDANRDVRHKADTDPRSVLRSKMVDEPAPQKSGNEGRSASFNSDTC